MKKKSIKINESSDSLEIKCSFCDKPITKTGKWGMDCEDGCSEKEAISMLKNQSPNLKNLLDRFGNLDQSHSGNCGGL